MTRFYQILADLVVTVHFAYVAFVIVGLIFTLAGAVLGWKWVSNFWFRATHLLMIGIVVAEAWCGVTCPLTTWEYQLRRLAGQTARDGSFVANVLHDAMFLDAEPIVFTLGYSLFDLAVLSTFLFAPPRRPSFRWVQARLQTVDKPADRE